MSVEPVNESLARQAPENPAANDWQDLGLKQVFLEDLALKILFFESELSSRDLSARMKLTLAVTDQIIQRLRKEQLCEIKGFVGGIYRLAISGQGRQRASDLLSRNTYVGPAPVPLEDYVWRVAAQSVRQARVGAAEVTHIFRHLALSDEALERIGTALASGTTLFLHGPAGTGKTAVAQVIAEAFGDSVWIPHAVEIDSQIITVFDPGVHRPVTDPTSLEDSLEDEDTDDRWVLCRRPCVILGGELTIEMLDLQLNPTTKFYAAPPQMKANNGVLVVDDFGRQRVRPEEMLNRWIVPLDRQVDLLSLAGGKKFDIPFDVMVVFATNMDLKALGDDAFLRRIGNKIPMNYVNRETFHHIFQHIATDYGVPYDRALTDYLIDLLTQRYKEPLRPCYPRDILRQVSWMARYRGQPPRLDAETLEKACRNYFLPGDSSGAAGRGALPIRAGQDG